MRYLRWIWAEIAHAATSIGYWIRPYDMLADRRRWAWRPAQPCGRRVLAEQPDLAQKLADRIRLLDGLDRRAAEQPEGSDQ